MKELAGYLVDLSEIGYTEAEFGQGYTDYLYEEDEEPTTLIFGDKNCDAFVFDKDWNVYYVKGLKYNDSMNHTL